MSGPNPFPVLRKYLSGSRLSVVDVGARKGLSGRWNGYESIIEAIGFEPDSEECSKLNSNAGSLPYPATFLPFALGVADGATEGLHLTRQPGCSSLFRPNEAFAREFPGWPDMELVRTVEVPLARMDTVMAQRGFRVDAIKVDVQGWELDVLKGMGERVRECLTIELEVEFVEQYLGQPLFHEVSAYLHARGFALRGIRRTCWRYALPVPWRRSPRGGQLVHGDALFVNRSLGVIAGVAPTLDLTGMLKGLAALAAYRQDDAVLWLLAGAKGSLAQLDQADRLAIAGELVPERRTLAGPILDRLFRSEASRKLRGFVDGLRDGRAEDWHDPELY